MKEIVPPNWLSVLATPLLVWMVYHVLTHRTATEILINSFRTGAPFFVVFAGYAGVVWYYDAARTSIFSWDAVAVVILGPFGAAFAGAFFYFLGASMRDLVLWVPKGLDMLSGPIEWSSAPTVGIAVCIPLIIGGLLFCIRRNMRVLYGATETLMGIIVFMSSLSAKRPGVKVTDPAFALAMLTASIYLVVRGLDNVDQGWQEKEKDLGVKLLTVVAKLVKRLSESRA